jgi:hypothetical protein
MSEIQGHKSNEISPLDRINDERPPFIIEIAGEPISNERVTTIHWGSHLPSPTNHRAISPGVSP